MEKHLELKERFDQLMKQDMDVSEHEQEWFELLDDMHEWLRIRQFREIFVGSLNL